MQIPMQVSFRSMERSAAIEAKVRERAQKLDHYYDRIMACRVVIEAPHRRHHQGKLYHVRIDVTVPGGELLATREPAQHHAYEDVYVAIRDAFDAVQRQLEEYARQQRRAVKVHETLPLGRVARLFRTEGYGFIETAVGREVYFHKNSLLNHSFERLEIGSNVQFVEEQGNEGPQASSVRVIGGRSAEPQ
jgi:ribosomal subunit interface protein